jgi:hypothetical protein
MGMICDKMPITQHSHDFSAFRISTTASLQPVKNHGTAQRNNNAMLQQ